MIVKSTRAARGALLTTVSAASLVLAGNSSAEAQSTTPAWWASVEGQYNWVDGDAIDLSDLDGGPFGEFFGSSSSVGPEMGYAGRLHLGARFGDGWSGAIGVRYGMTDKESDSGSYYYSEFAPSGAFSVKYDEDHLVLDLEIGKDVGIGNGGNARIFGGLRFARFDGDGSLSGAYYYSEFRQGGGSVDFDISNKFTGIGPRVGVDASIPLAQSLQADIGVAGAALFGKRKAKLNGSFYYSEFGGEEISDSDNKSTIVPNVEASVALTYLLSPNARISAGFKAEQFWNIMPTFETSGPSKDDRLIYGPFLKLTITGL